VSNFLTKVFDPPVEKSCRPWGTMLASAKSVCDCHKRQGGCPWRL
jgi:hypothetical protein